MWESVLDLVFPKRCALCDQVGRDAICGDCRKTFDVQGEVRLRAQSSALKDVSVLYAFTGRAAQAVKRLKYERATALARPMAEMVFEAAKKLRWEQVDGVVPVPISGRRYRERGFNQAALLCEGFDVGIVQSDWLKRVRHTTPQAALKADERLKNLEGAFEVRADVKGKSILLVDDVTTTGGTAVACAETLAASGAASVRMLAFCGERG